MYNIHDCNRYSYYLTEKFWELLNFTIASKPEGSIDYAVALRDKIIFQLAYSYGLRPQEILYLTNDNLNLGSDFRNSDSYGSIYISLANINEKGRKSRLIYSVFSDAIPSIEEFYNIKNYFFPNRERFITSTKGKLLTLHYLNKRLDYYNKKLNQDAIIKTLHVFRYLYLADLTRVNNIPAMFVNNQFGNNIIDNQLYWHILPNSKNGGESI